ncbi:MAG: hypothetical protein JNL26_11675 [Gemmatimonadetes bacterium]|nr:hypothetical protein [Gemmatimonadota bacterium]
MKLQVAYLTPHQNGKVLGIISAVTSLVFIVPIFLLMNVLAPDAEDALPMGMVLLFPALYLVMTYLMVAVSCMIYNAIVRYTGGIEYEAAQPPAAEP